MMTTNLYKRVSVLLAALVLPLILLLVQFQIAASFGAGGPAGQGPAEAPYEADVSQMPVDGVNAAVSNHNCNTAVNPIANCGFETGNFAGWITKEINGPFFPLQVAGAGISPGFGFFSSQPTEGSWAVLHGFDGNGPDIIEVAQDVVLPNYAKNLVFDYRAAWDMFNFPGSTQDRLFQVRIEPFGGGPPTQTTTILTATAGTVVTDTGNLVGIVDLSAFAGTAVRINFHWIVPESFTGPGFFQLDNVLVGQLPPGLYGITVNGDIIRINHQTGAAQLVGMLPFLYTEIEYDNVSGRGFVQEGNGAFQGYEVDLSTGLVIAGPIFNGGAYNGIEYVGATAYGTAIFGPLGPSELRILDPFSGGSALIGPTGVGPITGLAYDDDNGTMYATAGGGITTTNFFTIDLNTGVANLVGSTGVLIGGLQFGPDGKLYAGSAAGPAGPGDLYEINPATGAAAFVGPTGFTSISGLTLVGIDLALGKSASPDPAFVNQELNYTIVLTNNGPTTATNVVVLDTLPGGVTFVSANASQGSCGEAGGVVSCTLGALGNNSLATVDIVVIPTMVGVITNTATVTADQPDFLAANNTASTVTNVGLNMVYLPIALKP